MVTITLFGRFVARARDEDEALELIEEHKRNRAANHGRIAHKLPQPPEEIPDEYAIHPIEEGPTS